jgi:hypothetical protein
MHFNGDFHRFKCLQDFIAYKSMHNLVSNTSAIKAYFESMTLHSTGEPPLEEHTRKYLSDSMKEDIESSINHFGGLTVIGLCTCFEVAAKDFFKAFFLTKPKSMHDYLEHKTMQGSVAFDDITNSDSLGDLLAVLTDRAASRATKGHFSEVMRRVSKVSKYKLDKDVSKSLDQLQRLRNKIAHEKYDQSWDVPSIEKFENVVGKGIEELCKAASSNDIPGSYTCINPPTLYVDDDGDVSMLINIET